MSNQSIPGQQDVPGAQEGQVPTPGQSAPNANFVDASEDLKNLAVAKRVELGRNLMILAVTLWGLNAALSIKVMDEYTGFFEAFMRVDNILNAIMIYGSPIIFIVGLVIWSQNRSK